MQHARGADVDGRSMFGASDVGAVIARTAVDRVLNGVPVDNRID